VTLTPLQKEVFAALMWDYKYTPEQVGDTLLGNTPSCGHYSGEALFCKLLENYPWFTIIQVMPIDKIAYFLSRGIADKLRFKDMKKEYSDVANRLQSSL
jgi:hypothetical protein